MQRILIANIRKVSSSKVRTSALPVFLTHKGFSTAEPQQPPNLPNMDNEQILRIERRDKELRSRHKIIEGNIDSEAERDIARRKRMIYRSKQRGWLEVDLLLGSWASEFVPTLSLEELDEYEKVLDEETIDIYNYISGKDPLPPHLANLAIMKKLHSYAYGMGVINPDRYEDLKAKANLT